MESQELYCYKCESCGFLTLHFSSNCFQCSHNHLTNIKLSGLGTIYSYSKIHVGFGKMATQTPYYLAMIQLNEGLMVIGILVNSEESQIQFNSKVKFLTFTEDKIYKFQTIL